jgi:ketol-acid reductoisomerase
MMTSFRKILEDIRSGGFARRFQDEAASGYPMLDVARSIMHGPSPIALAEQRIRRLLAARGPSHE